MMSKRSSYDMDERAESPAPKMTKLEDDQETEKPTHSMSFPEQLMYVLDNDRESKGTIVWKEDGCTFWILTTEFIDKVLRVRFSGTKYESFVRKLNRWGFKRLHDQTLPYGTVAYRHDLFKRGHPELLKKMSGVKKKEKITSASDSRQVETRDKPMSDELRQLMRPQISIPPLQSPSSRIREALMQQQMLELLSQNPIVVPPAFSSPLSVRPTLPHLNPSLLQLQHNDGETLLNQLLQQRMSGLSASQLASLQLIAAAEAARIPSNNPRVSAELALLRLQQQLNGGSL